MNGKVPKYVMRTDVMFRKDVKGPVVDDGAAKSPSCTVS